tara:strand:- start:512 stop:721 length:210 start_codon:yes stop_codon:yes gene_type:complete
MSRHLFKRKCKVNNESCYYVPVGNIRSTQGENVYMTMTCRNCGTREDIFLTKEQYFTQQKLILKEIKNV